MEKLELKLENGGFIYNNPDYYKESVEALDSFLSSEHYMNSMDFARRVLFFQELQANNHVEGYNDDLGYIKNVIKYRNDKKLSEQKTRIVNLYNGYNYILEGKDINKENLKELYDLLSKGLLKPCDLNEMGEFYRKADVYITSLPFPREEDKAVKPENVERLMDSLFEYIEKTKCDSMTEEYIKSQIMHLYLVYIHPYLDINGRTGRTIALWELLNNKAYPYIIFNRGINFNKANYFKTIEDVKEFQTVAFFIKFMLDSVKYELEKKYVIDRIKSSTKEKLSITDYQTIYFILSMNSIRTVGDFIAYYKRHVGSKNNKEIYNNMILPLLDKGIITRGKETTNNIFDTNHNFLFDIDGSKLEIEEEKVPILKRKNKI